MSDLESHLLQLYLPLIGWTLLGAILGKIVSKQAAAYLGKFLFWVGVPISIVAFLRQANLSGPIWVAPLVAWAAIFLGAGLAWIWMKWRSTSTKVIQGKLAQDQFWQQWFTPITATESAWSSPTQGSFLLASMFGNTGYLGYPVTLILIGPTYFGWALFYDMAGTTFGAYGLGVLLAARFGAGAQSQWQLLQALLKNPALGSFFVGLLGRNIPLAIALEQVLHLAAWGAVALSLILAGMRLSQLSSWQSLSTASANLVIKMLLVPLILGLMLPIFGLSGLPRLVMVLQMAMPPAFATLVIAEAYNLDKNLAVTALTMGTIALLLTLPIWLWLFGV